MHDSGEDEAAVDAGRVGDIEDGFLDRGGFFGTVACDFPGVTGFVDLVLVGRKSGNWSACGLKYLIGRAYRSSKDSHWSSDGQPSSTVPLPL